MSKNSIGLSVIAALVVVVVVIVVFRVFMGNHVTHILSVVGTGPPY